MKITELSKEAREVIVQSVADGMDRWSERKRFWPVAVRKELASTDFIVLEEGAITFAQEMIDQVCELLDTALGLDK